MDEDSSVLGSARHPTPTSGGPEDVAAEMAQAMRDAGEGRRAGAPPSSRASASARPGSSATAPSRARATCRAGKGTFPLADELSAAARRRGPSSATTCRSRPTPSSSSARGGRYSSLLGVFWGTGVGGGAGRSTASAWRGRGGAGEIGHMVVELDGARCTCGRRGCMEAYAGRAAMEMHVRELVEEGRQDGPVQADGATRSATA